MTIEEIFKKIKYEFLNFNINKTVVITMIFVFAIIGIIKLQQEINSHEIKPAYINYTQEELEKIEIEMQETLDKKEINVMGLHATEDEMGKLGYGFKTLRNRDGTTREDTKEVQKELMKVLEKYQK